MSNYDYKKLQNGSDIRGVAVKVPGGPEVTLNMESAVRIALGFCLLLMKEKGVQAKDLTIAIGRDPRISGQGLEVAICQTLASKGVKVYSAGLATTPAMYMATKFAEYECDGAIMITASHMPFDRNGMKFFTKNGGLDKKDISEIISYAESDEALAPVNQGASITVNAMGEVVFPGSVESIDLMDLYAAHLRSIIDAGLSDGESAHAENELPLKGLSVTVDAGNGGGGFYAEKVLAPLGADVTSSQFLEPDGEFPNHMPNPEDREAMESICNQVKASKTDLGIIFDTDVDRASAVDENGKEIAHNGIVALAAALISDAHPGTTVVTDSVTSNELSKFLVDELGLSHLRFKRGYKNVINKAIELTESGQDCQLAIETSGHAAFKQNDYLDDGAYLATLIVVRAAKLKREGKGISSVIANLKEPLEEAEFRIPINAEDFSSKGDEILDALKNAVSSNGLSLGCELETPNYEGVRINFTDENINGWALLRKSLHDPLLPLNIASSQPGGSAAISAALKDFLSNYPELDISKM